MKCDRPLVWGLDKHVEIGFNDALDTFTVNSYGELEACNGG